MAKVFIIAEAGVNHNGKLRLAKRLVDVAKAAGADAVKFQTFSADELLIPAAPKAQYQKQNDPGQSQYEMIKKLELSRSDFKKLYEYCKKEKILFMSTPFGPKSAEFLHGLGMSIFKISSGELNNIPLLMQIAGYRKQIILSTGMATMSEIREAVNAVRLKSNKKLTLLHCTTNYPTRYEEANLRAMETLKKAFNVPVGYSDHTEGIEVAIAAAALGASVIEKHFTLDRGLPGPDQKASLEPEELKSMIRSVRNIEKAMGDGKKIPQRSEVAVKKIARKSIVAVCDIPKGAILKPAMLALKRPGTGIEPKYLYELMNKRVRSRIKKDQIITWRMVQI